jgi:hypothetical protein
MGSEGDSQAMCLSLDSPEADPDAECEVQILYLEVTLREEFNRKHQQDGGK